MKTAWATSQTDKSFLVLFFKKEQVFFLKKEAKTFILFSLILSALLALGGCGRKGWPLAPGPADQITFPRTYPSH